MPSAPEIPIDALPGRLAGRGRLLGLDLGTKTMGLAVSDVDRSLASPLRTLARTRFTQDAAALLGEIEAAGALALVVGFPVNMDGTEGPRAQATRAFLRNLRPRTAVPFVLWDERLSTVAVTRGLIAQDASRARRAEVVDRMAAAFILQGALDRLRWIAQEKGADPSAGPPTRFADS